MSFQFWFCLLFPCPISWLCNGATRSFSGYLLANCLLASEFGWVVTMTCRLGGGMQGHDDSAMCTSQSLVPVGPMGSYVEIGS